MVGWNEHQLQPPSQTEDEEILKVAIDNVSVRVICFPDNFVVQELVQLYCGHDRLYSLNRHNQTFSLPLTTTKYLFFV